VYVSVRFSPFDGFLVHHFFSYYLKMGVDGFLVNFNTKFLSMESQLNEVMKKVLDAYGSRVLFNTGPNGDNTTESANIHQLDHLLEEHVNVACDYIVPADSDEFHDYGMPLRDVLKHLDGEGADYVLGSTREHVTADGHIRPLVEGEDIFTQFPKAIGFGVMPKVSIVRATWGQMLGVGHHAVGPSRATGASAVRSGLVSVTHHFKWNTQGKEHVLEWLELMKDVNYPGWKGVKGYEEELAMFDKCLLDYEIE
jgi:hypothetical protein